MNPKIVGIAAAAIVVVAVIAVVAFLLVGRSSHGSAANKPAPASTAASPPPPVMASTLDALFPSPAQINTAMGATGITVTKTQEQMENTSASVHGSACVFAGARRIRRTMPAAGGVPFADRDWKMPPTSRRTSIWFYTYVVLFPSAGQAAAFFTASSQQRWPACSNRQYTAAAAENQSTTITWDVGPVSNTDGTLSLTKTQERTNGWACQRALAVRNNVVIDVSACSFNLADSAVKITNQIAAKVPKGVTVAGA
jgi:serine/threonine kinase PknH